MSGPLNHLDGTIRSMDLKNLQSTIIAGNFSQLQEREGPSLQISMVHAQGLVFDELGNLYVAIDSSIYKLNTTNYFSLFAGSPGPLLDGEGQAARFSLTRQMVFDSKGRIFVADQENDAIRMVNW